MLNIQIDVMIMSGVEDGKLHSFTLDEIPQGEITIGRGDDNHIVMMNDAAISRHHAIIHWRENLWWLEDCDSKNGTFIERDNRLDQQDRIRGTIPLESGQLFRVGKTWMRFQTFEWAAHA